jgi:hypothetical protein
LIKNVLFALLQFVLFSLVYVAGVILAAFPAYHFLSYVTIMADGTKFQWGGVLLALALFFLILLIEALRKRLRGAAPWTALAFVLAAVVEFVVRFGVTSPDR